MVNFSWKEFTKFIFKEEYKMRVVSFVQYIVSYFRIKIVMSFIMYYEQEYAKL